MITLGLGLSLDDQSQGRSLIQTNLLADWTFKQGADPQLVVDAGPNALHLTRGATSGSEASDFTWNSVTASFAPTQYAGIADNALLDMGTVDFTIYFVYKPGTVTGTQELITKRGTGVNGANKGWGFRQNAANLQLELDDGTAAHFSVPTTLKTAVFVVGTWITIGISFHRGGLANYYQNGAGLNAVDISALTDISGTQPFRVGVNPVDSATNPMTGEMRRIIIYKNIAHSAAQQLDIYTYLKQDALAAGIVIP